MLDDQERGLRGRLTRSETERQQARARAAAHLIGESAMRIRSGEDLTRRELDILRTLTTKNSTKEVAAVFHASSTRSFKRKNYGHIQKKLGARNMAHAVRLGVEDGLIPLPETVLEIAKPLSEAQKEVLELISFGASRTEIADIMEIAAPTVLTHVQEIKTRYDVQTDEQIVMTGASTGELELSQAA